MGNCKLRRMLTLDIFQAPMRREGFSLGDRLQEHRMVKGFYVTYVRQ